MKIIFIFPQEPTTVIKHKSEDISTYKADNDSFTNKYLNCRILGLQRKLSTEELMLLNCGVGEDS